MSNTHPTKNKSKNYDSSQRTSQERMADRFVRLKNGKINRDQLKTPINITQLTGGINDTIWNNPRGSVVTDGVSSYEAGNPRQLVCLDDRGEIDNSLLPAPDITIFKKFNTHFVAHYLYYTMAMSMSPEGTDLLETRKPQHYVFYKLQNGTISPQLIKNDNATLSTYLGITYVQAKTSFLSMNEDMTKIFWIFRSDNNWVYRRYDFATKALEINRTTAMNPNVVSCADSSATHSSIGFHPGLRNVIARTVSDPDKTSCIVNFGETSTQTNNSMVSNFWATEYNRGIRYENDAVTISNGGIYGALGVTNQCKNSAGSTTYAQHQLWIYKAFPDGGISVWGGGAFGRVSDSNSRVMVFPPKVSVVGENIYATCQLGSYSYNNSVYQFYKIVNVLYNGVFAESTSSLWSDASTNIRLEKIPNSSTNTMLSYFNAGFYNPVGEFDSEQGGTFPIMDLDTISVLAQPDPSTGFEKKLLEYRVHMNASGGATPTTPPPDPSQAGVTVNISGNFLTITFTNCTTKSWRVYRGSNTFYTTTGGGDNVTMTLDDLATLCSPSLSDGVQYTVKAEGSNADTSSSASDFFNYQSGAVVPTTKDIVFNPTASIGSVSFSGQGTKQITVALAAAAGQSAFAEIEYSVPSGSTAPDSFTVSSNGNATDPVTLSAGQLIAYSLPNESPYMTQTQLNNWTGGTWTNSEHYKLSSHTLAQSYSVSGVTNSGSKRYIRIGVKNTASGTLAFAILFNITNLQ